jgi:protein-S-isoprenylcysteine O-methyltransferase Ste14
VFKFLRHPTFFGEAVFAILLQSKRAALIVLFFILVCSTFAFAPTLNYEKKKIIYFLVSDKI